MYYIWRELASSSLPGHYNSSMALYHDSFSGCEIYQRDTIVVVVVPLAIADVVVVVIVLYRKIIVYFLFSCKTTLGA